MIASLQNQQVKQVRRLQSNRRERYALGLFVIEGSRWLREFKDCKESVTAVYYTDEWLNQSKNLQLIELFKSKATAVSTQVMKAMSDTTNPSGVLAVAKMPRPDFPDDPAFLLILDSISDPGNMGTLIRTAAAASVEAIFLSPNCVDIYNPKVIRSSMGGLLKLPIFQKGWQEIRNLTSELSTFALDTGGTICYSDVDWLTKTALMVGNEGHGLSQEGIGLAQELISIPMNPSVESLNASIATGIVLFEAVRQKNLSNLGL